MAQAQIDTLNKLLGEWGTALDQRELKSLVVGQHYIIKAIIVKDTRYGKCLLVHLIDRSSLELFQCWLPRRIFELMPTEVINTINNSAAGQYALTYLGEKPCFGSCTRSHVRFEFVGHQSIS